MSRQIILGDCRDVLKTLPDQSAQACVTSPPYWGLRDYGVDGQLGLEQSPGEYVSSMVAVFREVRRVLKDNGTLWLNLGDSYLCKSLVGIPWMVALALREDGWYLRSDIIWHKPNPMPESVTDRPTKAHEYMFLLSKTDRYLYDALSVNEPRVTSGDRYVGARSDSSRMSFRSDGGRSGSSLKYERTGSQPRVGDRSRRNRRTVWTVATRPFKGAHFATMPPGLVEPCIKAGTAIGDTVLDPFSGAGTTGLVAEQLGRSFIGIELNPSYVEIAEQRLTQGLR